MVLLGYILMFILLSSDESREVTPLEIFLGILLGIIYLAWGLRSDFFLGHLKPGWFDLVFFSTGCIFVFGISYLLTSNGSWLIGIPIAGFAVERLSPRRRLIVYFFLLAAMVLPIGLRHGSWMGALINSATLGTAILFVALFVQLRLDEQNAREHAEKLLQELEGANRQLAVYSTKVEELTMTKERNRVAREIHDNLGHCLTIVNVQIEAARVLMESNSERALDALDKAQNLTKEGLTQVRQSVAALRESPVSNQSLAEAIKLLVRDTQDTGLVTEFKVEGDSIPLDHKVSLALYRAAQEGLTNVRRHARASRVDIQLNYQPEEVCLAITDNGMGATNSSEGFGLLGIRERMQLLGGRLEIDTEARSGFSIKASVPIMMKNHTTTRS